MAGSLLGGIHSKIKEEGGGAESGHQDTSLYPPMICLFSQRNISRSSAGKIIVKKIFISSLYTNHFGLGTRTHVNERPWPVAERQRTRHVLRMPARPQSKHVQASN